MKQKLTLYPDTFLWRRGSNALLYNAQRGNMLKFEVSDTVGALSKGLENVDNLYSVIVDLESAEEDVKVFAGNVQTGEFGRVDSVDSATISLPPMLNLQHAVERLMTDRDRGIGENVLEYLSTLTIYVGGNCVDKPYFKQILYPICSSDILSAEVIAEYLDAIMTPAIHTVNIVVSETTYVSAAIMAQCLTAHRERVVFYILFNDSDGDFEVPHMLTSAGYNVRLICGCSDNSCFNAAMRNNIAAMQRGQYPFGFNFIIRSDDEYKFWCELVENLEIEDCVMVPVYDDNLEFFEQNVFMTEEDVAENKLSRREVFAHQALNTEAFGKLTVMPNGMVYSDVTAPALGTIEDSIYEIIVWELDRNYAWRQIRNSDPCRQCVYQWLCPSPTSYERAAGRKHVCTFNNWCKSCYSDLPSEYQKPSREEEKPSVEACKFN